MWHGNDDGNTKKGKNGSDAQLCVNTKTSCRCYCQQRVKYISSSCKHRKDDGIQGKKKNSSDTQLSVNEP